MRVRPFSSCAFFFSNASDHSELLKFACTPLPFAVVILVGFWELEFWNWKGQELGLEFGHWNSQEWRSTKRIVAHDIEINLACSWRFKFKIAISSCKYVPDPETQKFDQHATDQKFDSEIHSRRSKITKCRMEKDF